MYSIRMGVPEISDLWNDLTSRYDGGKLSWSEQTTFKKLVKAFELLRNNPRHVGLRSHDIDQLSKRYGKKVWQSYLENRKPAAGRIYWVYGPGRKEISIVGFEPHPEDKKRGGYEKVRLSDLPSEA